MAAELVRLRNVTIALGGTRVVQNVSGTVVAGQLVAIVGPNGSGKTSLVRAISGLLAVERGSIGLAGAETQDAPAHRTIGDQLLSPTQLPRNVLAQHLAYVGQRDAMDAGFSVEEVVLFGRYAHQRGAGFATAVDRQHAQRAMAQCDIAHLARRGFAQLSGGEAKRVMLAVAFCQQAPLLVLDEPTAALDPAHARQLFTLLRAHCQRPGGGAVIVVTHDLDLALRFADAVWLMHHGRCTSAGAAAAVFASAAAQTAFGLPLHVGTLPDGSKFLVPA